MIEKKYVIVNKKIHKKLKQIALDKESTIRKELESILENALELKTS